MVSLTSQNKSRNKDIPSVLLRRHNESYIAARKLVRLRQCLGLKISIENCIKD
jgi:hypothetical protein